MQTLTNKFNRMSELLKMIHEQIIEYSEQLNEVEKEIVRKYKAGEDYSADVTKANVLKMLQEETLRMMVRRQ